MLRVPHAPEQNHLILFLMVMVMVVMVGLKFSSKKILEFSGRILRLSMSNAAFECECEY